MPYPDRFAPTALDSARTGVCKVGKGHVAIEANCVGKAQVMLARLGEHRFIDL